MNNSEPVSPRRRLQELLAVPERQRTEAQWDEINELEIILAPGNREGSPEQGVRRDGAPPTGHPKPGGGAHDRKPGRRFHKRPPRGNAR